MNKKKRREKAGTAKIRHHDIEIEEEVKKNGLRESTKDPEKGKNIKNKNNRIGKKNNAKKK